MSEPAPFYSDVADAPEGARAFWMNAADGTRLRAAVWPGGEAGTAVVFPGRTEFVEKYGRVAGRLVERGLSVAVIDWRGQGLSQRHPLTPHLGHVEDFRRYQDDVEALLAHPEVAALPGPRHMIAHSMGACIGLRTLLERSEFATAIFSAPMWHLQMRAATRELTAKMTRLASAFGLGLRLTPGASPRPTALSVAFEANALTSDPEHFAWCVAQITAHPELSLGGPNVQWTRAALEEMARLYVAPLPSLPVLTFLGSEERVVSASVIRTQMRAMRAGRLVELDGARHEIFMERPEILAAVWDEIDAFLPTPAARRTG
ncbi:alpha/beta fold hydrolase [Amaricoccus sp.]|uniref:alpha/beta fold hydrolase n=1 Tax=Amaricoccus sp. TaxID=1872485 RepID=UPI001B705150|nr:alpha/beta hydrolase [Amaricoccus sp.]MBP7001837.1 alpha/beta hydrolase [Amaricoccus sp.]